MKLTLYWNSRASHGGFTILTSTPVQQQKKCRTFFRAVSMVPEARQSAVCASQKKTKKNQGHGHSRVSHGWRSIDRTQHWDRPQLPGADKRTATAEIHWYTLVTYISDFRKPLGFGRCIANSNLSSSATPLKQYSCASYVDILKGCLEGSSVNISWLKGMTTAEPPMIAGISTGDTGGTIEADLFFLFWESSSESKTYWYLWLYLLDQIVSVVIVIINFSKH